MAGRYLRVSIYLNESDEWRGRPLHLEILRLLHKRGLAGGTVLHAVAGFTAKGSVETTTLVDAGGKLPLVVEFIDSVEKIEEVMPQVRAMVARRLIVQAVVEVVGGLPS